MPDPYAVLGLTRSASTKQVKEAYKRLALRWHPDLCPDHERNQAEAAFKDIAAAYARISKGTRKMSGAQASPSFTNALVAFCLIVPLVMTGVQFGKTYPKWEEQSWRRHGIMSPPVNPWLKEEQRATEFSHLKSWQHGSQKGTSDSAQ
ncbi:MAG: putative molecular chaperone family [Trebouxia sp. A1-2]|nr:MAG: putative molecular chaperone family [Trebouxia sp. A1-2]